MGDETGVPLQPGLNLGMFRRAVVVHHQVQRHRAREFLVQPPQKFKPLLVAVAGLTLTDDPPLQNLQRGKQRRGAVALVIVRHRCAAAFLQR